MNNLYILLLHTIGSFLPRSNIKFIGIIGKKFREFCAYKITNKIGKSVNIERGARLLSGATIGDFSGVGVNCQLAPGVKLGKNVMMGPECLFFTRNHIFNKSEKNYQGHSNIDPITVEDDVWLGARVIVLPGVTIGKCSTIGAGAVVTKDIPAYSVAVGNPAKVVKKLI